jgi:glutamate-1-semialdehyde 2,1-aminomutase
MMKVVAIVQARMGSTRLPNKVMKVIGGRPMIALLLSRLSMAKQISEVVVATSTDSKNLPLANAVRDLGFCCFQGSEDDVLDRYYQAAKQSRADVIVRITGDCPLVDPTLVDEMIMGYRSNNVDYFSNINPPTYPDGLDIEVFSIGALERAASEATSSFDREHATPYLRASNQFKKAGMVNSEDH